MDRWWKKQKGGIESLSKHFTRVRKAFLIGESTEAFANVMENKVDYVKCCNLEDAFRLAFEEVLNSAEEVTILLSPACASLINGKISRNVVKHFVECLKISGTITHAV